MNIALRAGLLAERGKSEKEKITQTDKKTVYIKIIDTRNF